MIPELGKYAGAVLSAYGVSLLLLAALVALSLVRGARVRAQLRAVERRVQAGPHGADAAPEPGAAPNEGHRAHG